MAKKDDTFTPVVRKREIEYPATGPTGATTEPDVVYELGFEYDGAFVRLGSTTQALVDAAVKRHGYTKEDEKSDGNDGESSGSTS